MIERKVEYDVEGELFFITLWGNGEKLHSVYVQEMKRDESGVEFYATSESAKKHLEAKVPGFAEHLWLLERTFDEMDAEAEELALSEAMTSGTQSIDAFKQ